MSDELVHHIDRRTKVIVREEYRTNGKLHRDPSEGPAVICRDPRTAKVDAEYYYVNGKKHRDDGPAEYFFAESGRVCWMAYYKDGRLHRDWHAGPALIQRDGETGKITEEVYYSRGSYHRPHKDGPALIDYTPKEKPYGEHYDKGHVIYEEFLHLPAGPARRMTKAASERSLADLRKARLAKNEP